VSLLLATLALAAQGPDIRGYVQPQFVARYRPQGNDVERYEVGMASSRAGLAFEGAATERWSYTLDLVVGADTVLVVGEVYTGDDDFDGEFNSIVTDKTPVLASIVRETTTEWRPSDDLGLRVGRMQVPFSTQDLSPDTALMFPNRASPTDSFREPVDLGALLELGQGGELVSGAFGLFNGNGLGVDTASERGAAVLGRIDWNPAGFFAFDETDRGWEGFRVGFGLGALWHPYTSFDDSGTIQATHQDFRGSGSVRMATKGVLFSGEFLWSYAFDDLTDRPSTAYGAFGQLGWLQQSGVEPVGRLGFTQEIEGTEPWLIGWAEGGVNVYPIEGDDRDRVRINLLAQSEHRITEGETALAANAGVQVTF